MTYLTPPLPGMVELAPGVWRRVDKEEPAGFLGSAHSDRYHRPGCHYAARIRPHNELCFRGEAAAIAYGRRPCLACRPQEAAQEG